MASSGSKRLPCVQTHCTLRATALVNWLTDLAKQPPPLLLQPVPT
jgi:hypothetical protein